MLRRATAILALVLPLGLSLGCSDECQVLSDIICDCEETRGERESCRGQVDSQQQNQPPPTEEQRALCAARQESCTCAALEENRTDLCGFTREVSE